MKDQITILMEALRLVGWSWITSNAGGKVETPRWMPSKLSSMTQG